MSRLVAVVVVVVVAGCGRFDLDEPIQLVPARDWHPAHIDAVERAATCWNLGFGTRFEVVAEPSTEQVVFVDFNTFACWGAAGVFTPGDQARIDLCPIDFRYENFLPVFGVTLHELGHATGIRDEGSGESSVMGENVRAISSSGNDSPFRMFTDEDRALFRDANGDRAAPCAGVELVRLANDQSFCQCPD